MPVLKDRHFLLYRHDYLLAFIFAYVYNKISILKQNVYYLILLLVILTFNKLFEILFIRKINQAISSKIV